MTADWDYIGVFEEGEDRRGAPFFGRHGVRSFSGNPLPHGTIDQSADTVVTPGGVDFTLHTVNTTSYKWQESQDGITFTDLSERSKLLLRHWDHVEGAAGTYYFRALLYGWLGQTHTTIKSVTVRYREPTCYVVPGQVIDRTVRMAAVSTFEDALQWEILVGDTWMPIEGETGVTLYRVYGDLDGGTYSYRCIATGLGGVAISNDVDVHIPYIRPEIMIDPPYKEGTVPLTIGLSAYYSPEGVMLQWQKDGEDIVGATSDSYTETIIDPGVYHYRCRATNGDKVVYSNVSTITATPEPEPEETEENLE